MPLGVPQTLVPNAANGFGGFGMTRALSVAALLAALAAASPALAETPKDTVVMAKNIDDLISLDPAEAYEFSGIEVDTNVYDRLIRYEAEDLTKMVGGVAESWTVSADGHTITLKLRPGQSFQSGAPVTAADAAFSLQRVVILDKSPGFLLSQLGWTKDNVAGMVRALDASTLQLTVPEKFAPSLVLSLLSSIVGSVVEQKVAMAHEAAGDMGNGWLKAHSAGSGAFRLLSWKPNESVTMEANPKYRLGAPGIHRVVIRHVPEPSSQRLLLEKGDVDIARDLTPDQITALAGDPAIITQALPSTDIWYLAMNQSEEHLKNPKVREALKYLIDYKGMADSFLKGRMSPHETFLPNGFFGALDYQPFKLDVAKAKSLLAEAGYPNGFDITLTSFSSSPGQDIAQSLQQTLGQAGVKVNLIPVEQKQLYTIYRGRKHQLALLYWGPDYLDPHTNADGFAYNPDNSDTATHRVLAWRNNWFIPEISKQVAAAAQELDTAKREAEYHDLQKRVTDTGPYAFMFQTLSPVGTRKGVNGFVVGISSDLVYYRKITK